MIEGLKPYEAYGDSGLPWLPRMPAHWETKRSKYLFKEVDHRSVTGTEQRLSMSQRHGLIPSTQVEERRLVSASNLGSKVCQPGDLVLNRLKAHLGVIAVSPSHGVVSPDYTVLRSFGGVDQRYFCEVYRSPRCGQELRTRAKGIVEGFWRLYTDDFYDIRVPVPPLDEQQAIVRFLGWANGRLDRAIRAKRRVIALLNEQKQAITLRAVTRGLDEKVALKPSGVPWLGDLPETWQAIRLKHGITPIEQGWSPQCDTQPASESGWGVLKVGCVNGDAFQPAQNKALPEALKPDPALEVRHGDILMSRANTRALVGLAAMVEHPPKRRMLCDKLFRFHALDDWFDGQYLVLALRSKPVRAQIEAATSGASDSMQNIGQAVVKNLWVAVPPIQEQVAIKALVSVESRPLNVAITRLDQEIALINEYRTRLTADIVTGQLDVREAAARLPAEPEAADIDIADNDPEHADLIDDTETADEDTALP